LDRIKKTGSGQKRCSKTHSSRSAKIWRDVHRSPAAILAPSPKCRPISDGRDIGKYGKVNGASPAGSGTWAAPELKFRIAQPDRTCQPFRAVCFFESEGCRSLRFSGPKSFDELWDTLGSRRLDPLSRRSVLSRTPTPGSSAIWQVASGRRIAIGLETALFRVIGSHLVSVAAKCG